MMSIWNPWHQKRHDKKPWEKRYYWPSWKPIYIFKNTKTLKWNVKFNKTITEEGFVPPKYKGDIFGLILILIGFGLQLKFYL